MFRALGWLADIHDATAQLVLDVAVVRRRVSEIPTRLTRLENLIVTTAQDVIARFDAATTEVASDLTALRSRLEAAVADKDEAVRTAVAGVLAEFDAPIARLEALGQDPADPVPAPAEPAPVDDEPAGGDPTEEAPSS